MVAQPLTSGSISAPARVLQRRTTRSIAARVSVVEKEYVSTTTPHVQKGGQRLRTLEELPKEHGIPIVGRLIEVGDEHFELASLFEKHNSDAIMVNCGVGGGWYLTVQGLDMMEEVQMKKGKDSYPKWADSIERLMMPLGRSPRNEEIHPWRVAIGKVLSQGSIMKLQMPLIQEEFTAAIRKIAASGETTPFVTVSKRLTYSAASRAAIGDVFSPKDLDELFPLSVETGQGVFSPSFGLKEGLPFSTYWRSHQTQKTLQKLFEKRIAEVLEGNREQIEFAGNDTVVKKVLATLEEEGIDTSFNDGMDITTRLAREVIVMMFAGTDTTAYTFCRSMMWLSRHPEWLEALNEEQDRLVAEFGPTLDRQVFSRSAVAMAVAQEVLRITPPMRVLYRKATKDISIGDIFVPEGTQIMLSPRRELLATGNGTKKFDPQHWLSEDRTECKVNDEPGNFAFGKGVRACPGKNLAIIEAVSMLAILGREVAKIEMSEEDQYREFFVIGAHPSGLPLKLTPRAP